MGKGPEMLIRKMVEAPAAEPRSIEGHAHEGPHSPEIPGLGAVPR